MASSPLPFTLLLFCFILVSLTSSSLTATSTDDGSVSLQIAATNNLEWPSAAKSLFDGELDEEIYGDDARRLLFWRRVKYYISYGAMSANRVPCPPRSGRSYYTHNCHIARGPAHPYSRGCSTITRCRR